jgi:uncharacterized membrane protein
MPELNWWILMSKHWGKFLGGLGGLLFALLVIQFKWASIFIMACIAIGIYLGWRLDISGGLKNMLDRLFSSKDEY